MKGCGPTAALKANISKMWNISRSPIKSHGIACETTAAHLVTEQKLAEVVVTEQREGGGGGREGELISNSLIIHCQTDTMIRM